MAHDLIASEQKRLSTKNNNDADVSMKRIFFLSHAAFRGRALNDRWCLPYLRSQISSIAPGISGLRMNQRQIFSLLAFSALNNVMPRSIPITSRLIHPVLGLNASGQALITSGLSLANVGGVSATSERPRP